MINEDKQIQLFSNNSQKYETAREKECYNSKICEKQTDISEYKQKNYGQTQKIKINRKKFSDQNEEYMDKNVFYFEEEQNYLEISSPSRTRRLQKMQQKQQEQNSQQQEEEREQEEQEEQEEEEKEEEILSEKDNVVQINRKFKKQMIVKSTIDQIINTTVPSGFRAKCILTVQNRLMGLSQLYKFYLKEEKVFLLAAKRQVLKLNSSYIISKNQQQINKHSIKNYLNTLQSNFTGTNFSLMKVVNEVEESVLEIQYKNNFLGYNGIRNLQVVKLNQVYSTKTLKAAIAKKQMKKLIFLRSIKPKLIDKSYKIDFRGKVKVASSKNLILTYGDVENEIFLLGKQSQHHYLVEIEFPLSILQAFAICLSSIDSKILVK